MLSVLIPYRGDGAHRDVLLEWVLKRYDALLPDAEICIGTTKEEPFNRGAARNAAFRVSSGDTLLIADADTVFHLPFLERGLRMLEESPRSWVLPYDSRGYYNLTQSYTEGLLQQPPQVVMPARENLQFDHELESWAGLLLLRREAYEEMGGYDENFVDWGYEDRAFALVLDVLWGPLRRVTNAYCLHLWHPEGPRFDSPFIGVNREKFYRYQAFSGNISAVRALKKNYL